MRKMMRKMRRRVVMERMRMEVKKKYEAAKGKVAKEADIFEKNKAAGSATKKAG